METDLTACGIWVEEGPARGGEGGLDRSCWALIFWMVGAACPWAQTRQVESMFWGLHRDQALTLPYLGTYLSLFSLFPFTFLLDLLLTARSPFDFIANLTLYTYD